MAVGSVQGIDLKLIPKELNKLSKKDNDVAFGDFLKQEINNVSKLEAESQAIANDFIAGKTDSIHDVMIASEKASLALQFTIEVRNKIMEAYQEIMRMQI